MAFCGCCGAEITLNSKIPAVWHAVAWDVAARSAHKLQGSDMGPSPTETDRKAGDMTKLYRCHYSRKVSGKPNMLFSERSSDHMYRRDIQQIARTELGQSSHSMAACEPGRCKWQSTGFSDASR